MTIEWICKHHRDLGKEQLYASLKLRSDVFVVEQKCAYPDLDGQDLEGDTHHLMGWEDDQLMAYLRLLDPQRMGAGDEAQILIGQLQELCGIFSGTDPARRLKADGFTHA